MKQALQSLKKAIFSYFSLNGFLVPQAEAEAAIREGVSFRGSNTLVLITAIFIASLGLNTNSVAVIIGAMLISPLMGPIVGIGLGVGVCDFELIKRSLRNLGVAALVSILTSAIYFLISPVSEGHSELLARTSPTIYDVLIGFFGGAAGILPGVAIATALMPPLCTVGYGLATAQAQYFFGALYLFVINSVYIALATFIGVKLMHYQPDATVNADRSRRVRRWVYGLAVVVLLPSIWMTYSMLRQSSYQMKVNRFVTEEFHFDGTQVVSQSATVVNGQRVINVTLSAQLRHYGLAGARLNIIQGGEALSGASATSADDIFRMAQATIMRQQQSIDSLRSAAALQTAADSVGATIAPELKVLFPQVRDIAVTRSVFGAVSSRRLDTVNVAMVSFVRPMSVQERAKFVEYLKARLRLKSIDIVNVTSEINLRELNSLQANDTVRRK